MIRSNALVRLLDRRTRSLWRHLPLAVAGNDLGVHQARVASRRLREAVPVLTDGLHHTQAGKADRKVRRLTQALGRVRELDVSLHVIAELEHKPGVPRTAITDVRAHVMEMREERRREMHARLADANVEKLQRRLESVRAALAAPGPGHNWRAALASRIVTRARRLDEAIETAGQVYAPEALHGVRIAAKKLRYALEIAHESKAAPAAAALGRLKRAQETLGRLHDLQVLQQHVAAVSVDEAARHPAAEPALAILSRLIEDECRRQHGRYMSMVPALRETVEVARRDVAVRVTAVRRRAAKMGMPERRVASGER